MTATARAGKRILCVDDNDDHLNILTALLDDSGYDVIPARSGGEALAKIASLPDLVLLDVNLPDMDGFEVCRHLKKRPSSENVPVIFISGETERKVEGFNAGGVDYVTKPYRPDELLARIGVMIKLFATAPKPAGHAVAAAPVAGGAGLALMQNKYVAEELIARGPMSTVYRGRHGTLDIPICIKVLDKEAVEAAGERGIRQLTDEAKLLARINHPSVVRVFDANRENEIFYVITEFIDGFTLGDFVEKHGVLSATNLAKLAVKSVEGLRAAEAVGVIHRDIKPQNIMITSQNRVKILDFGLAKKKLDRETVRGDNIVFAGTPLYAAPEQFDDFEAVTFAVDVYALGATLYFALVGKPPFAGGRGFHTLMYKHKYESPYPISRFRPQIDPDLEKLVHRMLDKTPEKRADSLAAIEKEFRNLLTKLESCSSNGQ